MSDENATPTIIEAQPRTRRRQGVPKAQQRKYAEECRALQSKIGFAVIALQEARKSIPETTDVSATASMVDLALRILTGEES